MRKRPDCDYDKRNISVVICKKNGLWKKVKVNGKICYLKLLNGTNDHSSTIFLAKSC
jgi:hypothetical protein